MTIAEAIRQAYPKLSPELREAVKRDLEQWYWGMKPHVERK